jgi:alkyldihydroxyacetonephosphate synthase
MPDVKHMKWWGWGVEGVSFHHEDKPAFRPFVLNAIDLDVNTAPTAAMSLDDLPVPAAMISDELLAELTDAVGVENAVQDDLDRIVHTYGKSARDLLRIRAGDIPRVPDVVVYPGNEAEVQLVIDRAVAADAVIIPYGGGSNISGSLHAPEDETRPVISLDLGRMNRVIDIDETSGLARSARIWRNNSTHEAGSWAITPTASPIAPLAAGLRLVLQACNRTSTATSPTSPVACES